MKKGLKMGIAVTGAAIIAIIITFVIMIRNETDKAKDTLESYMNFINEKDYSAMYNMISKDSKDDITEDSFIARNKNIYEGINASDLKVDITEESGKGDTKTISYKTTMETSAGELNFDNSVELSKEDGEYKLCWKSNLIFPELENNYKVRVQNAKAKRGSIVDRNGIALANDGIVLNVGIVPGKLKDKESSIAKIAGILNISVEDINSKLNASYVNKDTFVPLKLISKDDSKKQELLSIPGIQMNDKPGRIYPLGEKAAHLTGYVQAISKEELESNTGKGYTTNSVIGKAGLEKLYEDEIRGIDGAEIYILDDSGEKVKTLISQEATDGKDIKLTIDSNLQTTLYNKFSSDKGASVAMNPNTGEVLALVSTPSYNPNDFVTGMNNDQWNALNNDANKPMFNRFKASFTPGSTFKPITAAIELNTNSINPSEDKAISGLSWQKDSSWGDYNVTRVESYDGPSNLENALIYSDNIYFAQAALDIGKDNFENGLKSLGFGEELDFPFGLTASSYSKNAGIDKEVQLADSGYGQAEILVNPVHLASMYTMFLNEGNMIKPYLKYKEERQGEVLKENVVSKEAASTVLNDMKKIIENPNGTGHAAFTPGLSLAGKTGTAEIKDSQDDTNGTETGWFVETTTDKGNNNLLVVGMVEDAKDKGGSHYVIPKVNEAFKNLK